MPASDTAPAPKLDQTDEAILDLLTADGRMSNREIGRALDIAEGTVRQRLKKLLDARAARIGLVTDVAAVGIAASAVLMINTEPQMARAAARQLAQLAGCGFVGLCFGQFDMTALVSAPTRAALAQLIEREVTPIPGIRAIIVRETLGWGKLRYDLVHIP